MYIYLKNSKRNCASTASMSRLRHGLLTPTGSYGYRHFRSRRKSTSVRQRLYTMTKTISACWSNAQCSLLTWGVSKTSSCLVKLKAKGRSCVCNSKQLRRQCEHTRGKALLDGARSLRKNWRKRRYEGTRLSSKSSPDCSLVCP